MENDNIFISYGHNVYDNIVKKIADDIRNCNFNVFLYIDYLRLSLI